MTLNYLHFLFANFILSKFSFSKSKDTLEEIRDYQKIKGDRKMFHKRAIKLHLRNKQLAKENNQLKNRLKMIHQICIEYKQKKDLNIILEILEYNSRSENN